MDSAVTDLFAFYQRELRETQDGRQALEKLHVTSPEVIDHFKLGYCSGRALAAASREQVRMLEAMNLVAHKQERFIGGVVMPVFDEDGQLVDMCGLRPWPSGLRFVFWQSPMRGLVGAAALRAYPEVVLTDNPFHALHVRQHGYPNVVALRSVDELRQHVPAFEQAGTTRVFLVARRSRQPITTILRGSGIPVVALKVPTDKVVLPKESLEPVGLTPACARSIEEARLVARTDSRLHYRVGDVNYKLESAAATGLGMRVQVRAECNEATFIDRVDLASAAARVKYAKACGPGIGMLSTAVEGHLSAIAAAMDELEDNSAEVGQSPPMLGQAEQQAATNVLKGDPLGFLAQAVEAAGFAGEPANIRMALLIAVSRLLDKPLGAIIRGPSSSGKSSLLRTIERLTPVQDVLSLSRLTSQALYFMPKDALQHKLLVVDEYEGLSNSEYALRAVMSNQALSLAIAVRENGKLPVTRTIEVPARLAVFVTTTGKVNIENLSRFIEMRLDVSPEQTQKVMLALASASRSAGESSVIHSARAAVSLLRPCVVEIPFADKLIYSARSVLARRQFVQVVGLVSAHARGVRIFQNSNSCAVPAFSCEFRI